MDEDRLDKPLVSKARSSHDAPPTTDVRNIIVLCVGVFLVYAGYNTTQVFADKLLGPAGRYSVAMFYFVSVFTGGSVPTYLTRKFSARTALVTSACIYSFYILSVVYCIVPVMFFASCLNGVAAGVLWSVLPAEVNRCTTEETRGFYNSLLWSSLKLSGIPGFAVAWYVLEHTAAAASKTESFRWVPGFTDDSWLFLALGVLCALGAVAFLGLRKPGAEADEEALGIVQETNTNTGNIITLLRKCNHIKCLLPLMFFSGFNLGIMYGSLAGVVGKFLLPKTYMVFSGVECLGSLGFGKLADHIGSAAVLTGSIFIQFVAVGWCCLVNSSLLASIGLSLDNQWYVATALLGLADAGFQSQAYATVGREYTGSSKLDAFCVFAVVQHIGLTVPWIAISVAYPDTFSLFRTYMFVDGGLALAAIVGYFASRQVPSFNY